MPARLLLLCLLLRSSWLTLEGGREVSAAGVLRRGGRAAVVVSVGVAVGVPDQECARVLCGLLLSRVAARRCIDTLGPPAFPSSAPTPLLSPAAGSGGFDSSDFESALCEVERRVGSFRGLSLGSPWASVGAWVTSGMHTFR